MMSIGQLFRRGQRRKASAQARLVAAYARTFNGTGGAEDAQIVLVDLARIAGYHSLTQPSAGSEALWFREGSRAVYARILLYLNLPDEALSALRSAVAIEDAATAEEGTEI